MLFYSSNSLFNLRIYFYNIYLVLSYLSLIFFCVSVLAAAEHTLQGNKIFVNTHRIDFMNRYWNYFIVALLLQNFSACWASLI